MDPLLTAFLLPLGVVLLTALIIGSIGLLLLLVGAPLDVAVGLVLMATIAGVATYLSRSKTGAQKEERR